MGLDGNLAFGSQGQVPANRGENFKELARFDRSGCSPAEVDRLKCALLDARLIGLQPDFRSDRLEKRFCCTFPIELQVEGAKIAALAAEGDVKIEADGVGHDESVNGTGFE